MRPARRGSVARGRRRARLPIPGTTQPTRYRPRFHYELLTCGVRGHELVGVGAAEVRPGDALVVREADGVRWHRCLRCDSWLPLPPPERPRRRFPPERDEIALPLRGKPLRDKVVLRLIAVDRALHFGVLTALGLAILAFVGHRAALRGRFYRVLADVQGGVGGGPVHVGRHGLVHDVDRLFSLQAGTVRLLAFGILAYGALEGVEAVGLWLARRWAEYLTFVATTVFLPYEVRELIARVTWFRLLAFVLNVAVVVYLLVAKRLFGLRGGGRADEAARERDTGWEALERTAPERIADA